MKQKVNIDKYVGKDGKYIISIMQNGGEFNDVGHYHMHIFPRYTGDRFGWTYGNEEKKVNSEIAEQIREQIK